MNSQTLYLTDLDGTLLTPRQQLSPFTIQTINHLISKGMLFTYATARSHHSASSLTQALCLTAPIIVNNGAFILENGTWKRLHENYFTPEEAERILRFLNHQGVHPLVYTYLSQEQKFSYLPQMLSRGCRNFLLAHPKDPRKRPVSAAEMLDGAIYYFTCIDDKDKLLPCYHQLKEKFRCDFQLDQYDGEYWLEIMPKCATKASAALKLKEMLGCNRIIAFGDGVNDIPVFEIADACYAVENAHEQLKKMATAVIDSNQSDGVAKWLLKNLQ